jgi:hypothetical protein
MEMQNVSPLVEAYRKPAEKKAVRKISSYGGQL